LLISAFEFLAVGVIIACVTFLLRRNVAKLKRFWSKEMTSWPRTDANIILITEILLMIAFLMLDTSDTLIQRNIHPDYSGFTISNFLSPILANCSTSFLEFVEHF